MKNVVLGVNNLATKNPKLAAEWHPTKNGELNAQQVGLSSNQKVWWMGSCSHEWEARISDRSSKGTGCPYCSNRRILSGFNDLFSQNPILAAEWHPTKNGELTAKQVVAGGKRKFWWFGKCSHEWEAIMENRIHAGHGCPYCAGRRALAGFNDLASTDADIAAEWHPTKNGQLTAQQITRGTPQKVWWQCSNNHAYESSVSNRTGEKKRGCPICSGQKVLAGFNDLASLDPVVASEWHPTRNGRLTAQQVTRFTRKKVWWQGTGCGHEWLGGIANRTIQRDKCPYCSSHRVLAGYNDLSSVRPDVAKEWHPTKNGNLTAEQVTSASPKKVWWIGSCSHEWEARIAKRTARGDGCGQCTNSVSKAEKQIQAYLESFGAIVEGSNRTILSGKEIDIWLPEYRIGIEFNGIYWHNEKFAGANSHLLKWQAAKAADIQLIQIWEDDWNLHPEIIMRTLAHKLKVSNPDSAAQSAKVIHITERQATEFLNENYLKGFASGQYYLGLVETGDTKTLRAVMVLDSELNSESQSLEIIRYATIANASDGFSKLLSYIHNSYMPESVTVIVDHCEADEKFYEHNDFIAEEELPPDYMYVIRAERKARSDYSRERFRDDQTLIWEEDLTEMELADLNGLKRIWDAGKTRYRLIVGK